MRTAIAAIVWFLYFCMLLLAKSVNYLSLTKVTENIEVNFLALFGLIFIIAAMVNLAKDYEKKNKKMED